MRPDLRLPTQNRSPPRQIALTTPLPVYETIATPALVLRPARIGSMRGGRKISFKPPHIIQMWLEAALKHEKLKYEKAPVGRDMVPEYEMAQGWGYVVAGYSLLEQSMKALVHLRRVHHVPSGHSLSVLFDLFETKDKEDLREFYSDYKATAPGMDAFPFITVDEFIENLDGDTNRRGSDHIGSSDWRYSPIEVAKSQTMPTVSIDFLHELIRGCNTLFEAAYKKNLDPVLFTNSWCMRRKRDIDIYRNWHVYMLNEPTSKWKTLSDRIEILWGPDYQDRYDFDYFKGERMRSFFCKIPDDIDLQIVDRREEIEHFDAEVELRSIGIGSPRFTK